MMAASPFPLLLLPRGIFLNIVPVDALVLPELDLGLPPQLHGLVDGVVLVADSDGTGVVEVVVAAVVARPAAPPAFVDDEVGHDTPRHVRELQTSRRGGRGRRACRRCRRGSVRETRRPDGRRGRRRDAGRTGSRRDERVARRRRVGDGSGAGAATRLPAREGASDSDPSPASQPGGASRIGRRCEGASDRGGLGSCRQTLGSHGHRFRLRAGADEAPERLRSPAAIIQLCCVIPCEESGVGLVHYVSFFIGSVVVESGERDPQGGCPSVSVCVWLVCPNARVQETRFRAVTRTESIVCR